MPQPINQHVLIRDDNHLIRYARTRHLTITTRVSRFVLLHTAPVPETTAPPCEGRAATPGWSNPQSPLGMGARPGTNFTGGPHDRTHPNHLGTHPNVGDLVPSLQDQLDQNEWDLEQARRAGNPNAIDTLLDQRNILLADIHNTRTTR